MTLEEYWEQYRDELPPGAPPQVLQALRGAFYLGASAVLQEHWLHEEFKGDESLRQMDDEIKDWAVKEGVKLG